MTTIDRQRQADALQLLAESLEIPSSHYEKAEKRYRSLGEWLERDGSTLADLVPLVYSQGSFRYGTVIPSDNGFDLDLVCELRMLQKIGQSQRDVKEAVGVEMASYAKAKAMYAKPKPTKRCWHLDYADDIHFHIDVLPSIPEDDDVKARIANEIERRGHGLGPLAQFAIAITDQTHPKFEVIGDRDWPMSNPKGFARWFEGRMRRAAERIFGAVRAVEEVPAYAWKTPLQVAIQILKQHRNTMFASDSQRQPISMIITTLAALAYESQMDLRETVRAIVDGIPALINRTAPRIPNPVNPGEDFADKWTSEPGLEEAFWEWHGELRLDLDRLGHDLSSTDLQRHFEKRFDVHLARERFADILPTLTAPAVLTARVESRPRPWGLEK